MARILLAPVNQNRAIYGIPCESKFRAVGINPNTGQMAETASRPSWQGVNH